MDSLEGQLLAGKYRVERVLGQGGMGVVVAAMHQTLEQRVALKFMVPSALDNEEAVGRFLREARSAVRLMSEHVARVIDVGTLENGAPFIVMEYLEGSDLSDIVRDRGPLSAADAIEYVLQACEALAEAHAAGIVHRDLKPANLFLTRRRDGTTCLKVLDFGIAKIAEKGADPALTRASGGMGTPYYMSPEQMRSARSADQRSDIWSLGIILYELLTGEVPFARDTLPALCATILTDPPPRLRDVLPGASEEIERVVSRCLEKEPSERYQDVSELALALAELSGEPGRASAERSRRIVRSGEFAAVRAPASATSSDTTPSGDAPSRRTRVDADTVPAGSGHVEQVDRAPSPRGSRRRALAWIAAPAVAIVALVAYGVTRPASSTASEASPSVSAAQEALPSTAGPPAPWIEVAGPPPAEPETEETAKDLAPPPVVVDSDRQVRRPARATAPRTPGTATPTPRPIAAPKPTSAFAIDDYGDRK